ncbi:hypothetical protein GUITHDRAFT_165705 [Guillardia theta CCMP2712]|uniref:Uncharacterized protein n=1 Tax=Guillardia theta (strain CCMP2712) TaxID=905079 RepID=L1IKE8_GUITC|nr:hypothetical protein GUITHDRAFT_165705 [Guillardia theta CCMP2712]EKX36597.1 hypothetical protein GUITHDRAFT_165705 [Guillardia theta CCMP2712]|eukprot:XP_005823577.1 hypothetical protein GUITHDRAFT_165705 [Guillardia theta CCMP2712]
MYLEYSGSKVTGSLVTMGRSRRLASVTTNTHAMSEAMNNATQSPRHADAMKNADDQYLSKTMREYKNIHVLAEHALMGVQKIDLQIPLLYTEEETENLRGLHETLRKCKSEDSICSMKPKPKWEDTVNPVLLMLLFVNILMFSVMLLMALLPRQHSV